MSQNDVADGASQLQTGSNEGPTQNPRSNLTATGMNLGTDTRPRYPRSDTRLNNIATSAQRDFKGATPDIGGVLALRSENVSVKTNYDKFCERLETYLMKELKGGEHVIEILKDLDIDIVAAYKNDNKPADLTDDEKNQTLK